MAAYKVAMVLLAEAELCVDRASGGGGTPGERSLVARQLLERARACSWASGVGGRPSAYTRRWEKGRKGVTV